MECVVEAVTVASRERYLELACEVFDRVDPARLREDTDHFDEHTRLYAFAEDDAYLSVLFVRRVVIAGEVFGGIGGVCTRSSHRGQGLGTRILAHAIEDTASRYDVLLLWTRAPGYFGRAGFIDASSHFEPDAKGSVPMLRFHSPRELPRPLPRHYF